MTVTHPNNIEMRIEGSQLTIVIDLSRDLGPSKSGRSRLVASTNGNLALPDGSKLGINCYRSLS